MHIIKIALTLLPEGVRVQRMDGCWRYPREDIKNKDTKNKMGIGVWLDSTPLLGLTLMIYVVAPVLTCNILYVMGL